MNFKGICLTVLLWRYPRNCCPQGARTSSAAAWNQEVPGPGSCRAWNHQSQDLQDLQDLHDRGCGSGHRRVHGNCHPCDHGSGTVKHNNTGYFWLILKVNTKCKLFVIINQLDNRQTYYYYCCCILTVVVVIVTSNKCMTRLVISTWQRPLRRDPLNVK